MFERFSRNARQVVVEAQEAAARAGAPEVRPALGDEFIGTEHLLLGLLRQGDSTALETLKAFDLTVDEVRRAVGEADRRAG